jgi:hypothetical protein
MNSEKENSILKRNDPHFVFSYITKEINNLHDTNNKQIKKQSIENLHKFIAQEKPNLKSEMIQEILITFNKNIIKLALFDEIEKVREHSIKILIQ